MTDPLPVLPAIDMPLLNGALAPLAPLDLADCYLRAREGEPRFTLLGRDRHAPRLLRHWADMREVEGEDAATVADARRIALDMERYRASYIAADAAAEAVRVAATRQQLAEHEGFLRSAVRKLRGG